MPKHRALFLISGAGLGLMFAHYRSESRRANEPERATEIQRQTANVKALRQSREADTRLTYYNGIVLRQPGTEKWHYSPTSNTVIFRDAATTDTRTAKPGAPIPDAWEDAK